MKERLTQREFEAVCRMLTAKYGIRVIVGGSKCATDGKTIYLPSLPEGAAAKMLLLRRYLLDHEAGHIVGESDSDYGKQIEQQYGTNGFHILNALEDLRIEAVMAKLWAGCGANIRDGIDVVLENLSKANPDALRHPMKQLTTALYLRGRGVADDALPDWLEDKFRVLAREADTKFDLRGLPARCDCTADIEPTLLGILKMLEDPESNQQPEPEPDKSGGKPEAGDGDGGGDGKGDGEFKPEKSEPDDDSDDDDSDDSEDDGPKDSQDESEPSDEDDSDGGKGEGKGKSQGEDGDDPEDGSGDSKSEPKQEPRLTPDMAKDIAEALDAAKAIDETYGTEAESSLSGDAAETLSREAENTGASAMCGDVSKHFRDIDPDIGGPRLVQDDLPSAARQRLTQLLLSERRTFWSGGRRRGAPDPRRIAALATGVGNRVMRSRVDQPAKDTAGCLIVDGSSSMKSGNRIDYAIDAAAAFAKVFDLCGHASEVLMFMEMEHICDPVVNQIAEDIAVKHQDEIDRLDRESKECFRKDGTYRTKDGCSSYWSRRHGALQAERNKVMLAARDEINKATERAMLERHGTTWAYALRLVRAKKYTDSYRTAKPKLMRMRRNLPNSGTPTGQAMHAAMGPLLRRPESRKIMMIFTDGQPDNVTAVHLACRSCERIGIEPMFIGIGADCSRLHRNSVRVNAGELCAETMRQLQRVLKPSHV